MPSKKSIFIMVTLVIALGLITAPFLQAAIPRTIFNTNQQVSQKSETILKDPLVVEDPLDVEKTVWAEEIWDEEITAEVGDVIRFNLTVSDVLIDSYSLYDIYVNDTLPEFLEFNDNVDIHGVDPSYVTCENTSTFISWYIDHNVHDKSIHIEFDALVTDTGEGDNLLEVTSNYCSGSMIYSDSDTVLITINPECSGEISGVKFNDENGNENQDCGEESIQGWNIDLYKAVSCTDENVIWIDEVITYVEGTQKDNDAIESYRTNPQQAIGPAVDEDEENYVSLGFNGSGHIILKFTDNLLVDDAGDDLELIETSFGSQTCETYPEKVDVYVSPNNIDWDYIGTGCLDSTFDLSNGIEQYNWIKYVKIEDATEDTETHTFEMNADGFDVNGVKALNTKCWEHVTTVTTDESGHYEFTELCEGIYKVKEQMQTDWINTTPNYKIVTITDQTETVNFGNQQEISDIPELTVKKYVKLNCCTPYYDTGVHVGTDATDRWVRFNITIEGNGDFDEVIVIDDLPDGLVSHDDLTFDLGSQTGVWSETIYIDAEIENDFCGNITNIVNVTGTYDCEQELLVSDDAWVDIECEQEPQEPEEPDDLLIVNKQVKPDCSECEYEDSISFDINDDVDIVTYKVDIHLDDDNGNFTKPIENLSIRDNLPQLSGLQYNNSYIKNEDGTYYNEYTITITNKFIYWNFTEFVMPGSSFSLYYCANVIGCGDFENKVNVTAMYFDGSPCCPEYLYENDTAMVEVICGPGLDVTKEASVDASTWSSDSVESFVGNYVFFRITVENTGYEILDGVKVLDTLPDFLEYRYMHDDGGADIVKTNCENETYDISWFFNEVDVGETIVIKFAAEVIDLGQDENLVTVHDCPDEGQNVTGDSDTVEIVVDDGMNVAKMVRDDSGDDAFENNISAVPGETVEWVVYVSYHNTNTSAYMHHILINDTLPEGVTYVDNSAEILRSNGTSFMMNPEIIDDYLIWDLNEEFLQHGEYLMLYFKTIIDDDIEYGLLENHVNITAKICENTYPSGEATATVYVTIPDNSPPEITDRSPANEDTGVDIDAVLEVTVDDEEDDLLTITFYNASDDSIIEVFTNENPPETVSTTWNDLEYNTTYEWYVTVSDENNTVTSDIWNFTTMEEPTNVAPNDPDNPNPNDNAQGIVVNPTLSVHVSDPDGDSLTVRFYDASTDQQIGFDECTSDCTASTTWNGLTHDTTYSWYVKVSDGEFEVESDTWSFTTETQDIDFEIDISGGFGINVDITNTGMDTANDVDWQIDIENKGLLNRINKTYSGTDDISGNEMLSLDTIRLINIARITVEVTVNHDSLDTPVTETAEGFVFGIFIRL